MNLIRLSLWRENAFRVDRKAGEPLAMTGRITQSGLGSFRAPVIQMKIIFPGEAHAAMNLNSAIAHCVARIAGVKFRDRNSSSGIRSALLESPSRVINCRTSTLRFKIHVSALVLHGLKRANGFAKLFASFRIFDSDIECTLHSADGLGCESGCSNIESSGQSVCFAKLFSGC